MANRRGGMAEGKGRHTHCLQEEAGCHLYHSCHPVTHGPPLPQVRHSGVKGWSDPLTLRTMASDYADPAVASALKWFNGTCVRMVGLLGLLFECLLAPIGMYFFLGEVTTPCHRSLKICRPLPFESPVTI